MECTAKRRQSDPAMPSTPAVRDLVRDRPGISDNAKLATLSTLAVFHNKPEGPRRNGSPTFAIDDAARWVLIDAATSTTREIAPKVRVTRQPRRLS